MALLHDLVQVQNLRLSCGVYNLGRVRIDIHAVDLDQVPQVVVGPKELCLPSLQHDVDVLMGQ